MTMQEKLDRMVQTQLASRGISDERVLNAFREIPRERFLPEATRHRAFEDGAVEIGQGQTISQPYVVALMTQALQLIGKEKVLEIGVGSGYGAAILSQLCAEYYGIEFLGPLLERAKVILETLHIRNVSFKEGDGNYGWPEMAPFDAISVTAAAKAVPPPLIEQLAVGGRLVIPVGTETNSQKLLRITKLKGGKLHEENLGAVAFVPFVGSEKWHHFN